MKDSNLRLHDPQIESRLNKAKSKVDYLKKLYFKYSRTKWINLLGILILSALIIGFILSFIIQIPQLNDIRYSYNLSGSLVILLAFGVFGLILNHFRINKILWEIDSIINEGNEAINYTLDSLNLNYEDQ